jgi:hypothetical protein
MDAWIAVGGIRPPGIAGGGGWDWWTLAGASAVFLLIETARRRPPLALGIGLAALGGLIVADLVEAFGVVPVWGLLLMYTLARTLSRSGRRSQV